MNTEGLPEPSSRVFVETLAQALDLQVGVVCRLGADQLDVPSRCDGWSTRKVLEHSLGVTRKFTEFAAGGTDRPHAPNVDLRGLDHGQEIRDVARESATAWSATDLRRTCHLRFGSFPSGIAAGINLFDALAHTWDIAAAVHLDLPEGDELWEIGLRAARRVIPADRDLAHYGPALDSEPTAPALDQFLAFLGRCRG